jgi:hypothetical protein
MYIALEVSLLHAGFSVMFIHSLHFGDLGHHHIIVFCVLEFG